MTAPTQERYYCPRCGTTWWYTQAAGSGPEFTSVKEPPPEGVRRKLCPAHRWAESRHFPGKVRQVAREAKAEREENAARERAERERPDGPPGPRGSGGGRDG